MLVKLELLAFPHDSLEAYHDKSRAVLFIRVFVVDHLS
jgi:hypothetical protein